MGEAPATVGQDATRPTLLGGSIELPTNPCRHDGARRVEPWTGAPGTVGRVAVFGAGKMGLPLCAQFAGHGWSVVAVDVRPDVVAAINAGRSHVDGEAGLDEAIGSAHRAGRLRATTDGGSAAAEADVVVVIVPVMLDDELGPDYRHIDAAVESIGLGVHAGSLIVFETTLPVGDTRERFVPRLEARSGLRAERDLFVAFSPERLFSGQVLRNLATYPKLVGGVGDASTERAVAFYASVLDAEIVAMSSSEAAELSKLADTTYRDVNIALANELARYADRLGLDVQEVIAAANSQPYSHVHEPGLGVGGHCIPVYPHFLLSRAPDLELVRVARRVNDGQVGEAVRVLEAALGSLVGVPVLVLGVTYRDGVRETSYSRALPLIDRLRRHGATVFAFDPLLDDAEIERTGAIPHHRGEERPIRAIVSQTGDPAFRDLDFGCFPGLELVLDGRNSLRDVVLPSTVAYRGIGVPATGREGGGERAAHGSRPMLEPEALHSAASSSS